MACFSKPEHAEEIRSHDSVLPILDGDFFTSRPGISTHGDPRWSLSHHRGFGFEVPHEVGEVRGAQILDAAWGNSRLIRCPFEHPKTSASTPSIILFRSCRAEHFAGSYPENRPTGLRCLGFCKYGSSVFSSYDFGPFQRK